ncbi:hypothetical protein [Virgibacillus sediminis]|uniref:Uncharacterized protein n=1 Tax=Virgibacillus sediminis TaxID=202260 RepID=A0ABV7A442_9BACI
MTSDEWRELYLGISGLGDEWNTITYTPFGELEIKKKKEIPKIISRPKKQFIYLTKNNPLPTN